MDIPLEEEDSSDEEYRPDEEEEDETAEEVGEHDFSFIYYFLFSAIIEIVMCVLDRLFWKVTWRTPRLLHG